MSKKRHLHWGETSKPSGPCAYCGVRRAVNFDHVVPRSVVRTYNLNATDEMPSIPAKWLATVGACFECNILKGTRRLVPPGWRDEVAAMNRFFGGARWMVWNGDTQAEAFKAVHK